MERPELESVLRRAGSEDERLAWFGALLTREANLPGRLLIVGGSAIEIYLTSQLYISQDIDVVGDREAIRPVLRRWGFSPEEGRDGRTYWIKEGVGQVDLLGANDRSALPPRSKRTPFGLVLLGSVEYLIVRRLMRAGRERSTELFRQAEVLAAEYGADLDWRFVRSEAKSENVLPLYEQLRKQVRRAKPREGRLSPRLPPRSRPGPTQSPSRSPRRRNRPRQS